MSFLFSESVSLPHKKLLWNFLLKEYITYFDNIFLLPFGLAY